MKQIDAAALDLAAWMRAGDGVVFGQGTAEPETLTGALAAQRARIGGAQVFMGAGFSKTFQPEHADALRFRGIGGIGSHRKLAAAGCLDVLPCHVSRIPALMRSGAIAADVVMLQLSPPNARGEYSWSLANDYLRAAVQRARVVIAEVNAQAPWTPCDHPLTDAEITVRVDTDRPLMQLPAAAFGALERSIAAHVDPHIPERATLQVGIGAIPEAIVAQLSGRRDLGVHSGMIGDSVADLMERGVITNAYKGVDPGVTISGVLFGTDRLYRFAHQNPALRLAALDYTHAGPTLARLKSLVSINSALEVDLTGQVNAEALGADYLGAVGGQVDFVRAARQSEGGVSIIALPATARGGAESRIVARLSGPVTTARSEVDLIATEFGAVRLAGLGLRERMRAMIGIAAPAHRERLAEQAGLLQKEWA